MGAILLLCTANTCRSVMAQAFLSARLAGRGISIPVTSAGMLGGGHRPPPEVISVLAARGIDASGHRSRTVTKTDLTEAALVLGMAREHVRHAAVLEPGVWRRAFTLREFLDRGRQAGGRVPGEPLNSWLARTARGRDRRGLLGSDPADDVADPAGGPLRGYQVTADLLDELAGELVTLGWPTGCTACTGGTA